MVEIKGTTICGVKRDGKVAIAGDGQVTMGQSIVMKNTARKVRRLYKNQVVVGFAGAVADAFTLCDKFEGYLEEYPAICSGRRFRWPRNGALIKCCAIWKL